MYPRSKSFFQTSQLTAWKTPVSTKWIKNRKFIFYYLYKLHNFGQLIRKRKKKQYSLYYINILLNLLATIQNDIHWRIDPYNFHMSPVYYYDDKIHCVALNSWSEREKRYSWYNLALWTYAHYIIVCYSSQCFFATIVLYT